MAANNGPNDAENRIMGMILGSALGDAVGFFTEFLISAEAKEYYKNGFRLDSTSVNQTLYYPDDHRSKQDDSDWTDDTDMALCILLAFLHTGRIESQEIATRFKHWFHYGIRGTDAMPIGVGRQTRAVLTQDNYLYGPVGWARSYFVHPTASNYGTIGGSGNGAIMRTHAIAASMLSPRSRLFLKSDSLPPPPPVSTPNSLKRIFANHVFIPRRRKTGLT